MGNYLVKSKAYKGYHYSQLSKASLDYLHKRTLEMFKEVKEIFDNHQIKYMICGGTLLGACPGCEANGKFIPWDDDFDVCVFEEDYDRIREILIKELDSSMILHCQQTDSHYYHGWMKIKDKHSHVYPDESILEYNGVWIDLYMIRKIKKSEVNYLIVKEHLDYLNRRLAAGSISKEEFEKRVSDNNLLQKLNEEKKLLENSDSDEKVYIIWSASKIVLNEDWVLPLKTLSFEGIECTTFNKYEEYLLQHYGEDYKSFPPEEVRRVSINKVLFDE